MVGKKVLWKLSELHFGAEETAFGDNYLRRKRELRYKEDMERLLTSEVISIYIRKNLAKKLE